MGAWNSNTMVISMICVVLLLASSALSSTESEAPFIVAHKKATLNRLKSGAERVSVSIEISNQGSSTVYDVSLADDSWQTVSFEVVSGSTSKSWERLDAGGTLSHSFELEAKAKGMFQGAPAVITFRIPTKTALQEAYSTSIMPLDVLADKDPAEKFEWAKRLLAKYSSLASVITIVGLSVYLVATPSKSSGPKGSKKRR